MSLFSFKIFIGTSGHWTSFLEFKLLICLTSLKDTFKNSSFPLAFVSNILVALSMFLAPPRFY